MNWIERLGNYLAEKDYDKIRPSVEMMSEHFNLGGTFVYLDYKMVVVAYWFEVGLEADMIPALVCEYRNVDGHIQRHRFNPSFVPALKEMVEK